MPRVIKAPYVNIDADNVYNVAKPQQPELVIEIEDEAAAENAAKDIIGEAKKEAKNILSSAQSEAEKIIAKAKDSANAEAESIKEAARKKGYDEGYKRGDTESKKLVNNANETLRKAKAESQKIIEDIEPDTVNVIINICEKIIGNSLSLNPEVIMHLVREGIHRTSKAGYVNIHICPDDYDIVIDNKQTIMSYVGGSTQIEIINDYSLPRGACIIETPLGNIDSSLDLQLKQLLIDIRLMFENR